MTAEGIKHGSYAGYQQEQRRGEGTCAKCRKAAALYQKRYRKSSSERLAADKRSRSASSKAHAELARRHPAEYTALRSEYLREGQ